MTFPHLPPQRGATNRFSRRITSTKRYRAVRLGERGTELEFDESQERAEECFAETMLPAENNSNWFRHFADAILAGGLWELIRRYF